MARGYLITAIVGFFLVSGYGCGVKAHTYVMERERVDQANTGGNAGFINGPGHSSSMAGRPTRKVYVVEFEREKKEPKKAVVKPAAATTAVGPAETAAPAATATPTVSEAVTDEGTPAALTTTTTAEGQKVTQYTVQKDDTLQKIAKKVYNSYGKWTKIYDANKDKIKNPNFVKPGTVLTIPQD
jgi:LysM repeat protein